MDAGAKHQEFAESGFGGWADENSPRSGSYVEPQKIPSTTFDNISR
jgi:hypothetical protein